MNSTIELIFEFTYETIVSTIHPIESLIPVHTPENQKANSSNQVFQTSKNSHCKISFNHFKKTHARNNTFFNVSRKNSIAIGDDSPIHFCIVSPICVISSPNFSQNSEAILATLMAISQIFLKNSIICGL